MRLRYLALLIAALLIARPTTPLAQTPDFTGLDVLFIVDQSGSMGGTTYGAAPLYGDGSDPDNLRFRAPEFALEQLTLYAEREALDNPRVALLTFGTDPDLLLNWTEVDPNEEDWAIQLNAVRQTISAEQFGERNLGFTDFLRAFAEARDLIANAPTAGPDERRLSAIVLLTDGSPCVDEELLLVDGELNCQQPRPEQEIPHLEDLAEFMTVALPNTRLYVVALDREDEYFERLQPTWEEVACATATECALPLQATQVTTTAELGQQIGRVLSDLVTDLSEGLIINERQPNEVFDIPPYTQLLSVTAFKSTAEPLTGVRLLGPDGAAADVRIDGANTPIEQFQVRTPQPGDWRIDINNLENPDLAADLRFQTEAILAVPSATLDEQAGAVYEPLAFDLALTDLETGQALPLYQDGDEVRFPLDLTLGFYDARPFERSQRPEIFSVAMERAPDATDQQFITSFRPQLPGVYEVRATATYPGPDGEPVTLLDGETLVERFDIAGSTIAWGGFNPSSQREGDPVSIAADIRRDDGSALTGLGALTLALSAVDEEGAPLDPPVTLYLEDESPDAGVVQAVLPLDFEPGLQRFELLLGVGTDDDFEPLLPQTPARADLTVRDVRALTLALTLPREDTSIVQDEFPRFWTVTPLSIQLTLTDDAGELLNLEDISAGAERVPLLRMERDGEVVPLPGALRQVRTGIYQLDVPDLAAGTYRIEAEISTAAEDLAGDFVYTQATVASNHTREDAEWVLPTIAALVAGAIASVLLVVLIFGVSRRRYLAMTRNPLTGRLSVSSVEGDELVPLWEMDLKTLNRNAYSFSSRELRGLPFVEFEITNYAAQNPQDRKLVTVTNLRVRSDVDASEELVPPVLILQPGESRSLPAITINTVPVEYVLGLDNAPLDANRAESVFNDAASRF